MRTKLTVLFVAHPPKPDKGSIVYWDDDPKGFGLAVTAAGFKSFVFNYRYAHKLRRIHFKPGLTLSRARNLAKRYQGQVASGRDPLGERKKIEGAEKNTLRAIMCLVLLGFDRAPCSNSPVPSPRTDRAARQTRNLLATRGVWAVAGSACGHIGLRKERKSTACRFRRRAGPQRIGKHRAPRPKQSAQHGTHASLPPGFKNPDNWRREMRLERRYALDTLLAGGLMMRSIWAASASNAWRFSTAYS
jgi:Arm DNA-binding domain